MPEKSKEDLEQIHEHNRRVLRELLFDLANWLDTQHAIRLLIPFFESPLQAADKLHRQMRSGALPWAIRWIRLREGLPVSHMVTRYPEPTELDAVAPESFIQGMREISEGNNTVVRYWDFVGRQRFNEWHGTLTEHERSRAAAPESKKGKRKPKPKKIEVALAIIRHLYPKARSVADVLIIAKTKKTVWQQVADPERWKKACKRLKVTHTPPGEDTVSAALDLLDR
jgi:hypothetical protein